MQAIFISPHFDDVALSCGGVAALVAQSGPAEVVTLFAGEPDRELNEFARFQHERWRTSEDTVSARRREDAAAMAALGVKYRWLAFLDAIYRGELYLSDEALFGEIRPEDQETAAAVAREVDGLVSDANVQVFLPLAVGGHVDHRIARNLAPALHDRGVSVRFYEDFPYAMNGGAIARAVAETGLSIVPETVDVTAVFDRRLAAIAAYQSQLATIFRHYGPWEDAVRAYATLVAGSTGCYAERLWRSA